MHGTADLLDEPDRGRIADAKIEKRVDAMHRIIRHMRDLPALFDLLDILAENTAWSRSNKAALKFLLVLLGRHRSTRGLQLLVGQQLRIAGFKH